MAQNPHTETLLSFLSTPLDSGEQVLARFAALPRAVVGEGSAPLQRYVYIPGTRPDRVVLVAHVDTVWDGAYDRPFIGEHTVEFADGVFRSGHPDVGIGADCRAGCAMLWELRDCGHSILVVDGEEHGKHGAKYLKRSDRRLFRELNDHCYMIEFDWQGTDGCLFNQVDNTKRFRQYVSTMGFEDSRQKGGTDLQVLCRRVCGVNVGVGYHGWHRPQETVVLAEWENTLEKISAHLGAPQRRFRSSVLRRYARLCKRYGSAVLRRLKIKK